MRVNRRTGALQLSGGNAQLAPVKQEKKNIIKGALRGLAALGVGLALFAGAVAPQVAWAADEAQTPANHWQVVNPGGMNYDENVRVRKTVEGTGTENEFKIHLSVDVKPQNDVSEVFNSSFWLENTSSGGAHDSSYVGTAQTVNGAEYSPGNKDFYYRIQFTDNEGIVHTSDIIHITCQQHPGQIFLKPGEISKGSTAFLGWAGKGQNHQSPSNPAVVKVNVTDDGYEEIFGQSSTSVELGQVTDSMGANISFNDFDGEHANAVEDNGKITWDLAGTKIDTNSSDSDGWINNVASLDYYITLNVGHSNGFPTSQTQGSVYPTNSSAQLSYGLVTTTQMGDGEPVAGDPVEQDPVAFPVPEVRGLLYDLVAKKTSSSSYEAEHKPLAGATFEIKNADDDVISSNVTSDENGQIAYERLPYGTYTITETKAPDGYQLPENVADRSWTVTLCYTTSASSLEPSSLNEGLDAMPSKEMQKEFVNPKAPVTYQIPVGKTIDGRPWREDDSFAFKIEAAGYSEGVSGEPAPMENQPMPMKDGEIASEVTVAYSDYLDTTNPDAGADAIGESEDISFSKPGYYYYKISEDSGTATDLEYSKETYLFWVEVVESKETGKLEIGGYSCELQTGVSTRALSNVPIFTNTYTASLLIKKTDEDGNPLGGAKFQVTRDDPKYDETVTTDEKTGEAKFDHLQNGTYIISEVYVPTGYQKIDDMQLVINTDGTADLTWKETGQPVGNNSNITPENGVFSITIQNYANPNLPSSGSSGAVVLGGVGIAAILTAGAWLARRKGIA